MKARLQACKQFLVGRVDLHCNSSKTELIISTSPNAPVNYGSGYT